MVKKCAQYTIEMVTAIFEDSIEMPTHEIAAKYGLPRNSVERVLARNTAAYLDVDPDLVARSKEARANRNNFYARNKRRTLMPDRYRRATRAGIAWVGLTPGPSV